MEFLPQSKVQDKLDEVAFALIKGQGNIVEIRSESNGFSTETEYTILCAGAEIKITQIR